MRAQVDQTLCQGHLRCVVAASEIFLIDEDGHGTVESDVVPPGQEESVRRAADNCPEAAVLLTEDV
jgi:ferredoxin